MHDAVDKLLHSSDAATPTDTAPRILAAYASHSATELVSSDIYLQAFVAAHHLVRLLSTRDVPEGWQQVDSAARSLPTEQQAIVSKAVFLSMADLLASPSCAVS